MPREAASCLGQRDIVLADRGRGPVVGAEAADDPVAGIPFERAVRKAVGKDRRAAVAWFAGEAVAYLAGEAEGKLGPLVTSNLDALARQPERELVDLGVAEDRGGSAAISPQPTKEAA